MFLLDANILIYLFQGLELVATLVESWAREGDLIFSVVTVAEFLAKATEDERKRLLQFLEGFDVLPVDFEVGVVAADYRRRFARKKKKVSLIDCFLAATARVHDLTLVTHNTADYPMKDIKILDPLR